MSINYEEELEARKELLKSMAGLIEKTLKIKDKQRNVVPFTLNDIQRDIVATRTGRDIYVKPRQIGASEIFIAMVLLETLLIPGTNSVIIAYEEEATKRLLAKSDFFYDALHADGWGFIPTRRADSEYKKTFEFLDASGKPWAPKSSFYISSARSFVVARNDSYHNVIADEFAFWPDSTKLVEVLGGVPHDGNVYILSTPNGEDNAHCEMYRTAIEKALLGANVYTGHFYPWYQHKEYRLKPDAKDALVKDRISPLDDIEAEEQLLIDSRGLDEEQIRWRRFKMAEIEQLRRMGETRSLFAQEFPEDDESCFLLFGNAAYDVNHLAEMMKQTREPIIRVHDADIWYPPEKNGYYHVAIDPGIGKYSMTAVTVWHFYYDGQKEVAQHCATAHGLWGPERTREIAWKLGEYYNWASMAIECNLETLIILMKDYPNLTHRRDLVSGVVSSEYGWLMTSKSKPVAMEELSRMLPNMICHDARIIREIRGMRYDDRERAVSEGLDDLHDSAAIAMITRQSRPIRRGFVGSYGRRK